jgi:hypothetical protein
MKSRRPSSDPKVPIAAPTIAGHRKHKQRLKGPDKWLFPNDTTTLQVTLPNEWLPEMDRAVDRLFPVLRDREDFLIKGCEYALASLKEEKEAAKVVARAKRKGGKK